MCWSTTRAAAILALLAVGKLALGQAYNWGRVSPDQAIAAVRTFEGDPNLAVTVTYTPPSDSPPAASADYWLVAGSHEYHVCAFAAEAYFWRSDTAYRDDPATFYGQPFDPPVLKYQSMNQDAARAVADAFMAAHYPEPAILTGLGTSSSCFGDPEFIEEYSFMYYQQPTTGVAGPSFCTVDVDSVRGQVVRYGASHLPVLVSTAPTVTAEQAAAQAVAAMGLQDAQLEKVQQIAVTKPDPFGIERLCYYLIVDGWPPDGSMSTYRWSAVVDAHDGTVIDTDVLLGLASKRPGRTKPLPRAFTHPNTAAIKARWRSSVAALGYPPLLIAGHPYLYVGYLAYGKPGAKVRFHPPSRVTISGGGQRVEFVVGAKTFIDQGSTVSLPAPVTKLRGRCYVPLEAARRVLPLHVEYDRDAREVRFGPVRGQRRQKKGAGHGAAGLAAVLAFDLAALGSAWRRARS